MFKILVGDKIKFVSLKNLKNQYYIDYVKFLKKDFEDEEFKINFIHFEHDKNNNNSVLINVYNSLGELTLNIYCALTAIYTHERFYNIHKDITNKYMEIYREYKFNLIKKELENQNRPKN